MGDDQGFILLLCRLSEMLSEPNCVSLLSLPLQCNDDFSLLLSLLLDSPSKPSLVRQLFLLLKNEDSRQTETAEFALSLVLEKPLDAETVAVFNDVCSQAESPKSLQYLSKRVLKQVSGHASESLLFSPLTQTAIAALQDDTPTLLREVMHLMEFVKGRESSLLAFLEGSAPVLRSLRELLECEDVTTVSDRITAMCCDSRNRDDSGLAVRFTLRYGRVQPLRLLQSLLPALAELVTMNETPSPEWVQNHPFFGSVSSPTSATLFEECPFVPILIVRVITDPILFPAETRQRLLQWSFSSLSHEHAIAPSEMEYLETVLQRSALRLRLSTQEAVDVVEKVMAHMASESSLLLALSLFGVLDSQEKAFLEQQMRVVLLVRVWGVYEG